MESLPATEINLPVGINPRIVLMNQLESATIRQLYSKASELHIRSYKKLKKHDLVYVIAEAELVA
ncbi:MAG: Rho termination factor N-terminal domain-containing protein [Microcystaceae cyanobacterium]